MAMKQRGHPGPGWHFCPIPTKNVSCGAWGLLPRTHPGPHHEQATSFRLWLWDLTGAKSCPTPGSGHVAQVTE